MANPRIAKRPIVVMDKHGPSFSVSVQTVPTGIWRQTGEEEVFDNITAARERAAVIADATGASVLMSFEVAITPQGNRRGGAK